MKLISKLLSGLMSLAGIGLLLLWFGAESAVQETSAATMATALFALAAVLLLGVIASELHRINEHFKFQRELQRQQMEDAIRSKRAE